MGGRTAFAVSSSSMRSASARLTGFGSGGGADLTGGGGGVVEAAAIERCGTGGALMLRLGLGGTLAFGAGATDCGRVGLGTQGGRILSGRSASFAGK